MNIDITEDKNVRIEINEQLRESIDMFVDSERSEVSEEVITPVRPHLREVNPKCAQLCSKKKDIFHSIVAKLLYLMMRALSNIETAIGFLFTRVGESDEDEWNNLRRVIAHLQCTINDVRLIGASS